MVGPPALSPACNLFCYGRKSKNPPRFHEALLALIGERVPLHIWGACGVGKAQLVAQVAEHLHYEFLDIRTVQARSVDLRGLPRVSADQTVWAPPKFLPTQAKGILNELHFAPQT